MSHRSIWTAILFASAVGSIAPTAFADAPKLLRPQDVAIPVDAAALQRQYDALSRMPSVEVTYTRLGLLRDLKGPTGIALTNSFRLLQQGEVAPEALAKLGPLLLASGSEVLTVRRNDIGPGMPYRKVVLQQSIRGIPVVNGLLALDVDDLNGTVRALQSHFVPDRGLPSEPKLTAAEASDRATKYLEGAGWAEPASVQVHGEPTLAYFAGTQEPQPPGLIWIVHVSYFRPSEGSESQQVWIDALDGNCRGVSPDAWAALPATVYTANGVEVSTGGFPSGLTQIPSTQDSVSQAALQNVTRGYDAWYGTFNEQIGPVGIVVHWGSINPGGAYHPGTGISWLAFGDGNDVFMPAGNSVDTAAHEYGHGIFYKYVPGASLLNEESGNINEAYGDYSAVMADVYHRGDLVTAASWQLYENYRLQPTRSDVSWSNPKAASVNHYDWYPTRAVGLSRAPHFNATIMGHAFYLISQGGQHARAGTAGIPVIQVPWIGFHKTMQIFYSGMRNLNPFPTFLQLRQATETAATTLYPGGSALTSVGKGWDAVGVGGTGCSGPPPAPSLQIENLFCRRHHPHSPSLLQRLRLRRLVTHCHTAVLPAVLVKPSRASRGG